MLDALVGADASPATRESFRKKLRNNELNDKEIEIQVADSGAADSRCSTFPAAGLDGDDQPRRNAGQGVRPAHRSRAASRSRTATTC